MTQPLLIPLPVEMEPYRADLGYFFQTMVRKLHVNRHKGTSNTLSLEMLFAGLQGEIAELEVAVAKEGQFDAPLEAADVANFAFLIAQTIWHMTREQWEEGQGVREKSRSLNSAGECKSCKSLNTLDYRAYTGKESLICLDCKDVHYTEKEGRNDQLAR